MATATGSGQRRLWYATGGGVARLDQRNGRITHKFDLGLGNGATLIDGGTLYMVDHFTHTFIRIDGVPSDLRAVDIDLTADEAGYYILDNRGRVHEFGSADYIGGSPVLGDGERAASMSITSTGLGYWIFTNLGRVFTYGDAVSYGDLTGVALAGDVVASIPTPTGLGYQMLGADGGIFAFGDVVFYGSLPQVLPPGRLPDAPIVGMAPTESGLGYWLVGEDGGMFSFGDAGFFGSIPGVLGSTPLAAPIVSMVPQGAGYLLVGSDGGIFNFSDSQFHGSIPGLDPPVMLDDAGQISAVAVLADKSGYLMVGGDGVIWAFGAATDIGDADVSVPLTPVGNEVSCGDPTDVWQHAWDWTRPFYGDVYFIDFPDHDFVPCN